MLELSAIIALELENTWVKLDDIHHAVGCLAAIPVSTIGLASEIIGITATIIYDFAVLLFKWANSSSDLNKRHALLKKHFGLVYPLVGKTLLLPISILVKIFCSEDVRKRLNEIDKTQSAGFINKI